MKKKTGVYLLLSTCGSMYKIGNSINITSRIKSLSSKWKISWESSYFIETDATRCKSLEKGLQKMLYDFQIIDLPRQDGFCEWYHINSLKICFQILNALNYYPEIGIPKPIRKEIVVLAKKTKKDFFINHDLNNQKSLQKIIEILNIFVGISLEKFYEIDDTNKQRPIYTLIFHYLDKYNHDFTTLFTKLNFILYSSMSAHRPFPSSQHCTSQTSCNLTFIIFYDQYAEMSSTISMYQSLEQFIKNNFLFQITDQVIGS